MQHTSQPTVFVNVFDNAKAKRHEAHDGVYTHRREAADAAEQYSESYLYTLTDAGKINLTPDFSEGFHEKRDFDASVDSAIDDRKELRFAREGV